MDIRNILNIISENSETVKGGSPLTDKLNVLTLGQFLNLSGIETPDEEDAEIDEAKLDAPARKMAGGDDSANRNDVLNSFLLMH
jgi:hypothetical protein